MWEAIRENERRSWILIGCMFALLLLLGYVLGLALVGEAGGGWGIAGALVLWTVLLVLSWTRGDELILLAAGAREASREEAPQLWNVVEEMAIASGLGGRLPRVYVIDDDMPNAFAVGRRKESAAIAVTSGLLVRLDRDELQGVVAHEIAHIANRDVSFTVVCSVMVGTIVILAEVLLRLVLYGSVARGRRSSSGGRFLNKGILLAGLVLAVLAPVFAQIIYFACSRRREYLADASAARFTRYPAGLASALEKISRPYASSSDPSRALAPLYIVNPLRGWKRASLFDTHPPVEKRIEVLRRMSGAGYKDYEVAFQGVFGRGNRCVGARTLAHQGGTVAVREPSAEAGDAGRSAVERAHDAADLVARLAGLITLGCPCGVWIRLGPETSRASVSCPRCGTEHRVPQAGDEPPGPRTGEPPVEEPLRYERQGDGWERFECRCGRPVEISPVFQASRIRCRSCRREIEVACAGARDVEAL